MPPATAADAPPPDPVEHFAALVVRCPGVASLSAGTFGEVATYLPGRRRVVGIRFNDNFVEVHVVAEWGSPLAAVAEQVRVVGGVFAAGRPIDVYIDDIEVPELLTAGG